MFEFTKFFAKNSPRKSRRTVDESSLGKEIRGGWFCRSAILLLFVIGLGFLIFTGAGADPLTKFVICLLILVTAVVQLWVNHPQTLASNPRMFLVFGSMFFQLAIVKLLIVQVSLERISPEMVLLLAPYAFAPLVLSVMLGKNHGLYAAVFCSLWAAFLFPGVNPILLVMSLISGFVAVFVTLQVRRRGRLVRAGIYVGLVTLVMAVIFGVVGPIDFGNLAAVDWATLGWRCMVVVGAGIGTAVVVSGVLPALESTFGVTTDISWLEMADLNHPLLKRLSLEAPGSYHHSLAVANLAEAAAEKVGANPTICRVASYFHDIGKLVKPDYFTENMHQGINPHDDLTPTMSALIIIAHVKEGVDLALKNRLNPQIVDVIREHHGNSLVSFFYQRALNQQRDAQLGGKIMNMRSEDIPQVSESSFRYPGPRPRTKESAIISLADAIESASRSLERPTPQRIEDMIAGLIHDRLEDGQLDDAPLTMQEIRTIAESFRFTLQSMLHSRVAYPKKQNPEEKTRTGSSPENQLRLAS